MPTRISLRDALCGAAFVALTFLTACGGGAPPSLPALDIVVEKEVGDLRAGLRDPEDAEAPTRHLAQRMTELRVPGVVVAVIHEGELRWVRAFEANLDEASQDASDTSPALGVDQPFPLGTLEQVLTTILRFRLDKDGQELDVPRAFDAELRGPLAMDHTVFGPAPADAAVGHDADGRPVPPPSDGAWSTAEDLAAVVVDLQKSHAGKPGRRLDQERTRRLLGTDGSPRRAQALGLHGTGQSRYFEHRARTIPGYRARLVGFTYSGHGAVVLANGDNAEPLIDEILGGLAEIHDWPAYRPDGSSPD